MQIKIAYDANTLEWCIIELQGTVEARENSINGLELGTFTMKSNGIPVLIIGNHQLEGKEIPLKKPLIILKNKESAEMDVDGDERKPNKQCVIIGIIRKKYLFKNRPKPITKMV